MNTDLLVNIIKNSKKYAMICDDTIKRIAAEESCRHKNDKMAIKSVKTRLHRISGMFIDADKIKQANRLLDDLNECNKVDIINRILKLHNSTAERLHFATELFDDIIAVTGRRGSILDIACGFNPFAVWSLPGMDELTYYATDIHLGVVDLINRFIHADGINGQAFAGDILYHIPQIEVDNVFLFKILPLLEQQQKGYSRTLIEQLKTKFITITFPTKSLSGKNVGMYSTYREFMLNHFSGTYEFVFEKEYANELLTIIKRKET